MKGKILTVKHLWGGVVAFAALCAVSCANGFESDEKYASDVRNTSLTSPSEIYVDYPVQRGDGKECIKVSWDLVKGAGGYLCNITNISDESSPEVIVADSIVDGFSVLFPYDSEDISRYVVSVKTLGNAELNNTGADDAKTRNINVGGESVSVTDNDFGKFVAKYLADNKDDLADKMAEDPNFEVAFTLESGAEYTFTESFDLGLLKARIRGIDPENRPKVTMKDYSIVTAAALRIMNINFEFEDGATANLIAMGTDTDNYTSISSETLGYKANGAERDCFFVEKPMKISNCWIKNLPKSILSASSKPWAFLEVTVDNCIVQLKNNGTAIFDFNGSGSGLIQNHTIQNSTFYSKEELNTNLINYPRSDDAPKVFGGSNSSTHFFINFIDSTFARFSKKQMGNNCKDSSSGEHTIKNCVFYNCFRLYQLFGRSSTTRTAENNILDYVTISEDSNDVPRFGVVESTGFTEATFGDIDFSEKNAGLNLKASGAIGTKSGDPRWR